MKIKFWGTRGSIAAPGRDTLVYGGNTTCLEITLESGRKVIVDAGTGIRELGDELLRETERVDVHLLISHIHWDHVLGFPFFYPACLPNSTLSIDGFPSCMRGLKAIFASGMGDGFFPVRFEDLKAEIRHLDRLSHGTLGIDGVTIDPVPLCHPQGGFGFRFREGRKTLVFMTDNEITSNLWNESRQSAFVEFCKGADLLIHDAQFTPEEIQSRRGWGHTDYVSAVELALRAEVGRLVLFHHAPSRKDPEVDHIKARCEEMVEQRGSGLKVDAAREKNELTL